MEVILVPGHNPGPYTGAGTNTYLLAGSPALLIDTATGDPRHLDALRAALASRSLDLGRVVVTHAHSDHIGGVDSIATRWPSAIFAKFPCPGRDETHAVQWQPLSDGDLLETGGTRLEVIHTPGHAPDHIALYDETAGDVFTGDLVVSRSTVVIPSTRGGDLLAYLASLRRILALGPARLLPAHGPAIDDPKALIEMYLAHRQRREEQIRDALALGLGDVDAIVGRVYGTLPSELTAAAAEQVLAHLRKLAAEGQARLLDDGRWESQSHT